MLRTLLEWLDSRRHLTTYRSLPSREYALLLAPGWLRDGYAVRIFKGRDGRWCLEAWEV